MQFAFARETRDAETGRQFIIERVMKKINKAKLPGWIEYIRIDEVDVGDVPPT
jgi:hypothetical protein